MHMRNYMLVETRRMKAANLNSIILILWLLVLGLIASLPAFGDSNQESANKCVHAHKHIRKGNFSHKSYIGHYDTHLNHTLHLKNVCSRKIYFYYCAPSYCGQFNKYYQHVMTVYPNGEFSISWSTPINLKVGSGGTTARITYRMPSYKAVFR